MKFYIHWLNTKTGQRGVCYCDKGIRSYKSERAAAKAAARFQANAPAELFLVYSVSTQFTV